MSAAEEAAAGLTTELVQELVHKVPAGPEDDVLKADLARMQAVEAPAEVSSPEAPVAQEVEQETESKEELPSFETEVPEDVIAFLDEPDFEAEAEAELQTEPEEAELEYEDDSDDRKARIAAEKKLAWMEQRLNEQNRGKWEAEAKKYFPLSEHVLGNIQADSRRAFLRQARSEHEKVLPYVKPLVERLNELADSTKTEATQEARAEAAAAWGQPTTGPGLVPVKSNADQAELEEARKTRNLSKVVGVLMKQSRGGE